MRIGTRRLVVAAATCAFALVAIAGVALAGTITTPGTSPFQVPAADADGFPAFFTIVATGYPVGAPVFVEQCDGVPPSTPDGSRTSAATPRPRVRRCSPTAREARRSRRAT